MNSRVPEGEGTENDTEAVFKDLKAEVMQSMVDEVQQSPRMIHKKKSTRHVIAKLQRQIKTPLSSQRKNWDCLQRNSRLTADKSPSKK